MWTKVPIYFNLLQRSTLLKLLMFESFTLITANILYDYCVDFETTKCRLDIALMKTLISLKFIESFIHSFWWEVSVNRHR